MGFAKSYLIAALACGKLNQWQKVREHNKKIIFLFTEKITSKTEEDWHILKNCYQTIGVINKIEKDVLGAQENYLQALSAGMKILKISSMNAKSVSFFCKVYQALAELYDTNTLENQVFKFASNMMENDNQTAFEQLRDFSIRFAEPVTLFSSLLAYYVLKSLIALIKQYYNNSNFLRSPLTDYLRTEQGENEFRQLQLQFENYSLIFPQSEALRKMETLSEKVNLQKEKIEQLEKKLAELKRPTLDSSDHVSNESNQNEFKNQQLITKYFKKRKMENIEDNALGQTKIQKR